MNRFSLPIFIYLFCSILCAEVIDLEEHIPDWVLETKQINIPGYVGAFNPCIVCHKDKFLLSFRVRNAQLVSTFQMGFVWLDAQFNLIGEPTILAIYGNPSPFSQEQDPRLIIYKDALYIFYSNFVHVDGMTTRRMLMAQVHEDGHHFYIKNPTVLHPFTGASDRWEKNWSPFIYQNNLLLEYSILPHRILKPLLSGECIDVYTSWSPIYWPWGELRGGSQAYLQGDEYLSFFHSSKKIASTQSGGKEMMHYFMGAYTFSAKPPFDITRMSQEPIVGKNFYEGPVHNTWKPLRVVFPMGFVADQHFVWVVYGRQDHEIWVVKLDKKGLFESLQPCNMQKMEELLQITPDFDDGVDALAEHPSNNS